MPCVRGGRNVDIVHADAEAPDDAAALQLRDHVGSHFRVGGEHRVGVARHFQNGIRLRLFRQAHFRADFRQHLARRIEVREHGVGNGNKFASVHPSHHARHSVHGNRGTIRNAPRRVEHPQHHGNAAFASQ